MVGITPPQVQNELTELSDEEPSMSILFPKYCIIIIENSNGFSNKNIFLIHLTHSIPLIRTGIESCKALVKFTKQF